MAAMRGCCQCDTCRCRFSAGHTRLGLRQHKGTQAAACGNRRWHTLGQLWQQGLQHWGVVRHAIGVQGPVEHILRLQLPQKGPDLAHRACTGHASASDAYIRCSESARTRMHKHTRLETHAHTHTHMHAHTQAHTCHGGAGWGVVACQHNVGAGAALPDLFCCQSSGCHQPIGGVVLQGQATAVVGDLHGLLPGAAAAGIRAGYLTCAHKGVKGQFLMQPQGHLQW